MCYICSTGGFLQVLTNFLNTFFTEHVQVTLLFRVSFLIYSGVIAKSCRIVEESHSVRKYISFMAEVLII